MYPFLGIEHQGNPYSLQQRGRATLRLYWDVMFEISERELPQDAECSKYTTTLSRFRQGQ